MIEQLRFLPSFWGFSFAGCEASFVGGSNLFLLMVVQQLVAILVFPQVSAHPYTPPS